MLVRGEVGTENFDSKLGYKLYSSPTMHPTHKAKKQRIMARFARARAVSHAYSHSLQPRTHCADLRRLCGLLARVRMRMPVSGGCRSFFSLI